ncbi:S-adenosyl-L-methionine-dependent methyltransferase, partial [Basidiobolus meristosporus CBS 931.73]
GDAESVITAIDRYAKTNLLMHVGDKKGKHIDDLIEEHNVKVMVELGGYLGYSALRFSNLLPPNGHYYSFELNPRFAKAAQTLVEHAGLTSKVTIIVGEFKTTSEDFLQTYAVDQIDLVFIDHWKDLYVQDMKIIEQLQWLRPGSVVVADNVLFPGAPDYKDYIEDKAE